MPRLYSSSLTSRLPALAVVLGGAVLLQGCVVGSVVGAGAAVVGGTAKVTGAVVGAGFDAVTTSDEETRARREREQRDWEREQRRCEQRERQGKRC
jgi:carbonic anhydrase/acetyltransferase-like protein (isoleucine patch superfamily)